MDNQDDMARPTDRALASEAPTGLQPPAFDPSRSAADSIPGYAEFIDGLAKVLADVPQPPIFASSTLFPNDSAMKFTHEKRDYLLAGPEFWAKVPAGRCSGATDPFSLGAIRIIDVDNPHERYMRSIVMAAIAGAMGIDCDSDRSGEAVETLGSTEGESAGMQGIAPNNPKEPTP